MFLFVCFSRWVHSLCIVTINILNMNAHKDKTPLAFFQKEVCVLVAQ